MKIDRLSGHLHGDGPRMAGRCEGDRLSAQQTTQYVDSAGSSTYRAS